MSIRTRNFIENEFDEAGVKPKHIKTLKDIAKLPFTTANDLRDGISVSPEIRSL